MFDYEKLDKLLYSAFLKGVESLGKDIKQVSWFARNKKTIHRHEDLERLEAA
ncbi:MAG: hypothetical protein H6905_06870 [Hyphomicrobiales bacterium]|nr:hypothetical protein [Hyphomicrobiales bacterium]